MAPRHWNQPPPFSMPHSAENEYAQCRRRETDAQEWQQQNPFRAINPWIQYICWICCWIRPQTPIKGSSDWCTYSNYVKRIWAARETRSQCQLIRYGNDSCRFHFRWFWSGRQHAWISGGSLGIHRWETVIRITVSSDTLVAERFMTWKWLLFDICIFVEP